jgi:hypothetical protein
MCLTPALKEKGNESEEKEEIYQTLRMKVQVFLKIITFLS